MTVQTSIELVVSLVSGEPVTQDQAGWEALTYTALGELTEVPEYGPSFAEETHTPLATGITEKFKGAKDNGSVALNLGWDPTDAGQVIVSAGTDGAGQNANHSFKLEYSDGTTEYFFGRIFSYTRNPGAAGIVGSTVQVGINSNVFQVAA